MVAMLPITGAASESNMRYLGIPLITGAVP